jgi:hypothetical protein
MTLAYRMGALNEADPLTRRLDFVPQATVPIFWDGEVPSDRKLRRKSQLLFEDGQLNLLVVNALQLSPELYDPIREGYSNDSFYGDEGEWTKDSRIEARDGSFWRLDRLCIPQNSEPRLRLITELHESSSYDHRGVASTLAKALDRFWWRRVRQDVKDFCERFVVCRRAKIQPHMAATLYPLLVPPIPWHTVGLDYLTHLPEGNGFNSVLIVVDHLTRMAHFLPCTESITAEKTATLFLQGVYHLHGLPRVLISDRDPKFVSGLWQTLWRRLGTRLNMSSSRYRETYGLTKRVNGTFQQLLRCFSCYDGSDWTMLLPQVEFAYNASRALGIDHTPFEANFGIFPEEPPDMLFSMRPSIPVSQDATERLRLLHEVHTRVRSVIQLHKDEMQARTEPSTAPHFARGDKVSVVTVDLFLRGQPNRKLRDKQLGPFTVEMQIGKRI